MAGQTLHVRRHIVMVLCGLGVVLFLWLLNRPLDDSRQGARRSQCRHNLQHIGLALHLYHDRWGSFPPAFVADEVGNPIHSWRTLILPYLDRLPRYDQYHFDEPWDGPRNASLRDERVFELDCPEGRGNRDGLTSYLAVVGPNTAWPGSRPAKREDFTDGLSSTILVVEVVDSGVQWMEPRDLNFDEMSFNVNDPAGKSISSRHQESDPWPWSRRAATAHVLFGDGTVRRLPVNTPTETIRALLTANGGEEVEVP